MEKEWKYRGEGNASLVIASEKEGIVYRLLKRRLIEDSQGSNHGKEKSKEYFEKVIRYKMGYITHVMTPVLGEEYVSPWKLVEVSRDFLQQMNEKFQYLRPQARLNTEVNTLCSHVIQLPDFCLLPGLQNDNAPTFCIEIKPKAGFLPTSDLISEDHQIKKSVCRFCMHQRLKVKEGKWSSLSGYCPVDLFSGQTLYMKNALSALFSNPQNNLRIFKNGALLYGVSNKHPPTKDDQIQLMNHLEPWYGESTDDDHCETMATSAPILSLQDVIIKALLNPSQDNTFQEPRRKRRKHDNKTPQRCAASRSHSKQFTDSIVCLPEGCVLYNMQKLQTLDSLDIEGIYPLYTRLQKHFEDHPSDREAWRLDGPYTKGFLTEDIDSVPVSLKESVRKIKEYLVAMTVKDCSIMLALQPIKENQASEMAFVEDGYHHRYCYKIQLADLDPKPFDNIPKYYQLDRDIVQNYIQQTS
ncbi:inositol-pentakisphosphate 2-kinase-like [Glandiceps talaboti]